MNMIEKLIGAADEAIQPLINDWYSEVIEDERAFARAAVRAVLTALSEPTPAMLNAAVDATDAGGGMSWVNRSPQKLFEQGWQAMLAAASKD